MKRIRFTHTRHDTHIGASGWKITNIRDARASCERDLKCYVYPSPNRQIWQKTKRLMALIKSMTKQKSMKFALFARGMAFDASGRKTRLRLSEKIYFQLSKCSFIVVLSALIRWWLGSRIAKWLMRRERELMKCKFCCAAHRQPRSTTGDCRNKSIVHFLHFYMLS